MVTIASLLTACSEVDNQFSISREDYDARALSFSAYVNRATRGGGVGYQTSTELCNNGFGVFAYYSDNVYYSQELAPNFMYNMKMTYSSWNDEWVYSPLTYWPNEHGSNVGSDNVDRLSFFAYAPYVEVSPGNGLLSDDYDGSSAATSATTGITRLSHSTVKGDPLVHYINTFIPADGVDLLWGVVPQAYGLEDFTFVGMDGKTEANVKAGFPYLNTYRPKANQKVVFNFNHALASLNIQVDATVDDSGNDIDDKTHIYVRSITFQGFATAGALNLNNTEKNKPLWLNYIGDTSLSVTPVTIYDQRRNGYEGIISDVNETPGGLNPIIVQSAKYSDTANLTSGVTKNRVNLFNSEDLTAPVYVIPNGVPIKVSIEYDVETEDSQIRNVYLADGETHGSVSTNSITHTIDDLTLESGKAYVLKLHLGLSTIKVESTMTSWIE